MLFGRRPRETPEQARQRRYCRFMLGLPPETVYHHVREGVATVVALGVLLVAAVAWQLGHLAALAPALVSGAAVTVLTPTVLMVHRRYRHVVAGALVLTAMLMLLAAAVHRSGYAATVGFVVGPPLSTIADAASPR
jgi:hypothetical protein